MLSLDQLRTETFLRGTEQHAEISSTNDRALELCAQPELPVPFLVLADQQTAGRGRGSNRWWSSDGALLFSVIIDANEYRLPEARWPQLSLTVGTAVCETLASLAENELSVGLKWPNDVWLNGRKVCGILVEIPVVRRGRLVIGVGLNVNNSFEFAPPELHTIATSLCDETRESFDRVEILAALLRQLDDDLRRLAASDSALAERWRSRCVLRDRLVTLDTGTQNITGECLGIAEDGALRLHLPSGEQRFFGGVIREISH